MSILFLSLVACDQDIRPPGDDAPVSEKRAWASTGAPSLLSDDLESTLTELPTSAEVSAIPWAGSYWPTYQDSINKRWAGADTQSPVEKYGEAFEVEGLPDQVSASFGIDSINNTSCSTNADCDSTKGESCSIRDGETEGTCIETWFGICHAWAPIAIMESEPDKAVTYNGVEFLVNDLKALATLQYHSGLSNKFMSLRCNDKSADISLDAYGNPTNQGCNDTNPGAFHIVITNFLGLKDQSLVEDRTYDYQVWNQPLRSYEVLVMNTVSAERANKLAGDSTGATDYLWNDDAVSFKWVKLRLDYISESHSSTGGNLGESIDNYTYSDVYTYILELDADGEIIGGEWTGGTKKNHPDFLWLPTKKKESKVAGIKWSDIDAMLMLAEDDSEEGFDWGDGCEAGDGAFAQDIEKAAIVTVGTLPGTKANVRVDLKSPEDVDLQLVDLSTGVEVVAWPYGTLNGYGEACTEVRDLTICWSGYNGDGTNYGHEWITIDGTLGHDFELKAYGYAAGAAEVTYSYESAPDCVDEGEGSFDQPIVEKDTVAVGIVPAGKENLSITLKANADVDVQLYDGQKALVEWPYGELSGPNSQSFTYEGSTITYSGYNGVNGDQGHETITVSGTLESDLIVKAYGYKAGDAEVTYSWGPN